MKKLLALILTMILCFGMVACGGNTETPAEDETPKVEDDGVMKILMIGHSLGNDSTYMLPEIARKNGVEKLVMGVLYHSGCRLGQHVEYLKAGAKQYAYYEFDISSEQTCWMRADASGGFHEFHSGDGNDELIASGEIGQTMEFGISRHDWDIVVMQAGVFEAANVTDGGYAPDFANHIQTIQNFVKEKDIEPATAPKFVWNMTWACPSDIMTYGNEFYANHTGNNFGGDTDKMYEAIASTVKDVVAPAADWAYIIPSGTAVQNVRTKLGPREAYRDFIHASDFSRAVVGYTWYCTLFEKTVEECVIESIDSELLLDNMMRNTGKDLEFTQEQKDFIAQCVKNALATPYAVMAAN